MESRRNLLWVDSLAGAAVGVAVLTALATGNWLPELYRLPRGLVMLTGWANLIYGAYSLSLALRRKRPMAMIIFLVMANSFWAMLCFRWVVLHFETGSFLGLGHLLLEGLFVGGLACLEWRWRHLLTTA